MLQDAIHTYLDGLNDDIAAESHHRLAELQRRHDLSFGDRLLCNVLRPRFLTAEQYRPILVGPNNSDPFRDYPMAINILARHFGVELDPVRCYPYRKP